MVQSERTSFNESLSHSNSHQGTIRGNDHHKKEGLRAGKALVRSLSQLALSIIESNTLVGRHLYMALIIIENFFMAGLLVMNSTPRSEQHTHSNGEEVSLADKVDTQYFHLYPLQSLEEEWPQGVPTHVIAMPLSLFTLNLIVVVLLVGTLVMQSRYYGKNRQKLQDQNTSRDQHQQPQGVVVYNVLSAWFALHRTLLTLLMGYAITISALMLNRFNSLAQAKSTDKVESSIFTQEYYLVLGLMTVGIICFLITMWLAFVVVRVPLFLHAMPWNSTPTTAVYFGELFKILIVTQDLILNKFEISNSYLLRVCYYLFLLLSMLGLCLASPTSFYDKGIDQVHKFSKRLLLCVVILCLIRIALFIDIIELAIFFPLVGYAILKSVHRRDQEKHFIGVQKLLDGKSFVTNEFVSTLQFLMNLLQVLKKEQQEASRTPNESHLTSDEHYILSHLHLSHRMSCYRDQCICEHFYYLCVQQFKEQEEEADDAQLLDYEWEKDFTQTQVSHKNSNVSSKSKKIAAETPNHKNKLIARPPNNKKKGINGSIDSTNMTQFAPPLKNNNNNKKKAKFSKSSKQVNINLQDQNLKNDSIQEFKPGFGQTALIALPTAKISQSKADSPPSRAKTMMRKKTIAPGKKSGMNVNALYKESTMMVFQDSDPNIAAQDSLAKISNIFKMDDQSNLKDIEQKSSLKHNHDDINDEEKWFLNPNNFSSKEDYRLALKKLCFKDYKNSQEYYFTEIIGLTVKDYHDLNRTRPDQLQGIGIKQEDIMLYAQFLNDYLNRPIQSLKILLQTQHQSGNQSHSQQQGIISEIQLKICEKVLLKGIIESMKNCGGYSDGLSSSSLNLSQYLENSTKILKLQNLLEQATEHIVEFWRQWNSQTPVIHELYETGRLISRYVREIKKTQNMIEEGGLLCIEESLFNISTQFYQVLLNDPITSNQMMYQMKTLLSAKRRESRHQTGEKFVDKFTKSGKGSNQGITDSSVCLVTCSNFPDRMEFLFVNKSFANLVGVAESQLKGRNIKAIMPKAYREHHDGLIANFFQRGNKNILGQARLIFIQDSQGFIKPVKFMVEFSYNQVFKYSFICSMRQQYSITSLNQESREISLEDVMIFLTDELFNITECTQNVLEFCGFNNSIGLWEETLENHAYKLNIDQFIQDINDIMFRDNGNSPKNNEISSLNNKIIKVRKYSREITGFTDEDTLFGVLTYIREDLAASLYQKNGPKQNTFIIIPLSKHPDKELLWQLYAGGSFIDDRSFNANQNYATSSLLIHKGEDGEEHKKQQHQTKFGILSEMSSQNGKEEGYDMSSQSSTSSMLNATDSAFFLHSQLLNDRTPRILAICIYILLSIFLSFLIVSIANLIIFLTKHSDITTRIEAYELSTEKILKARLILIDIKMMQWYSHYPESILINGSNISMSRKYEDILMNRDLPQAEDVFQTFNIFNTKLQSSFQFELGFDNLKFISDYGNLYYENQTYKYQMNLFLAYSSGLNVTAIESEKPILNISDIPYKQRPTTDSERRLFYLYQNGLREMQEVGMKQIQKIVDINSEQIQSTKQTLAFTTYISVGLISAILFALLPIINKLLKLQYVVLDILGYLSKEKVEKALKSCSDFQVLLQEVIADEGQVNVVDDVPEEEESFKLPEASENGSSVSKQSRHRTFKPTLFNQKSFKKSFTKQKSTINLESQFKKKETNKQLEDAASPKSVNREESDPSIQNQNQKKGESQEEGNHQEQSQNPEQVEQLDLRRVWIESQKAKANLSEWIWLLCSIILLMGYLNSSLVVTQRYTDQMFTDNEDSTGTMRGFYKREVCIQSVLLNLREMYITNQTQVEFIRDPVKGSVLVDSVSYYIQYCLQNERSINDIKRSPPTYFLEASKKLDEFDSDIMCSISFTSESEINECQTLLEGLLLKGMDSFIGFMASFVNQMHINFNADPQRRDNKALIEVLKNEKLLDLVNSVVFQVTVAVSLLQEEALASITNYFEKAKSYYLLIFSSFIGFTLVASIVLGLFMFKRAKRRMLELRDMLIVVPFAEIEPWQRNAIDKFINS